MNNWSCGVSIDDHILINILCRLSAKSLMRFKSVCKYWRWLVEKDAYFINMHSKIKHSPTQNILIFPVDGFTVEAYETYNRKKNLFLAAVENPLIDEDNNISVRQCETIVPPSNCYGRSVRMLNPVNGLVCFCYGHSPCCVFIYNPTTRQKTSWMEPTQPCTLAETSTLVTGTSKLVLGRKEMRNWRRKFGFGYSPATKEHKVLYILQISVNKSLSSHNGVEFYCEVLTVGDNIWRRIDDVPPLQYDLVRHESEYVNGYIYMFVRHKTYTGYYQPPLIMGFDVGSEKFNKIIKIPNFMLVGGLVAVDGHIAILDREGNHWINLWIYEENHLQAKNSSAAAAATSDSANIGGGKWTKEVISLPRQWPNTKLYNDKVCLSFEAISGTKLIILKFFASPVQLDCLYYYDREKKEYHKKQVEFIPAGDDSFPLFKKEDQSTPCPDYGYNIKTFSETLLPVEKGASNVECLPSDVILDILSRVPVESVLDCKLVCKMLLELLSDRSKQFAQMHSQQQLLQLANCSDAFSSSTGLLFSILAIEDGKKTNRLYYGDKYTDEMNIHENFSHKTLQKTSISFPDTAGWQVIVGSCNGLICLNKYRHGVPDPTHICNPNTGEYVNLPEYTLCEEGAGAAFGFGYVHSTTNAQYKVVRIYYDDLFGEGDDQGDVQVYTIGSGLGWRTIGKTSHILCRERRCGTHVDGVLYWIDDMEQIVAFNLSDEEFRLIRPPLVYNAFGLNASSLQVLRGNLCFCLQSDDVRLLEIWSLKTSTNTKEASWSKDFSIAFNLIEVDFEDFVTPLLVTKKNEVLLQVKYGLYCYDPELTAIVRLWDTKVGRITASPHMNSFVSLEALGEKSETKKKKKEVIQGNIEDTDAYLAYLLERDCYFTW